MKQQSKPVWWLIISFALIKFILPFILQYHLYELQRDEYLYFQQGQHLALGYLENPPFISWMAHISSWFGGTINSVRCWPSIVGAATLIVTCLITAELGGRAFAQLLTALCMLTGSFLRLFALFQPNMLDVFFWTLTIFYLIRFIRSRQTKDLILCSISLALGCWSKYSIAFVAIALLMGLLLSAQRKMLLDKRLYVALALTLVLIVPNIYWQYIHNWPLAHHMEELRDTQLKYLSKTGFIKDQFLMNLPSLFTWLAGLIFYLKSKTFKSIGFAWFFVIGLLMAAGGKSYYALGIYPALIAGGAVAWESWTNKIIWLRVVLVVITIATSALIIPMMMAVKEPQKLAGFYERHNIHNTWEDQKQHALPQDFADMLGWKELSDKSEKYFTSLPGTTRENSIVFCENYGEAGALLFYGKDKQFKKQLISSNGSFLLWMPKDLAFKHMIYVCEKLPDTTGQFFQHFEKRTVIDSVTDKYSRQFGSKILFLENADKAAHEIAEKLLNEKKKLFLRPAH